MNNTIVLITDFGVSSPYVAEMKGAILSINEQAVIVDGTHAVPPQDVTHGAWVLRQLADAFPLGTVFVAVVDPGVGTRREIILVEANGRRFIGPDNGLFSLVVENATRVATLDQPKFWRTHVSSTFHGRDIMGPAAAYLTLGIAPTEMASTAKHDIVRIPWPTMQVDDSQIVGQLVYIDAFGNLISNIPATALGACSGRVEFAEDSLAIRSTYGEQNSGTPIALVGSRGWLELAIVNGNAQQYWGAQVGDAVRYVNDAS